MHIYDLIGIGFGPSNLSLAIALDEQRILGRRINTLFIEKQPRFAWHKDMLLEHADMQVSFLKDLATLRNPSSPFTFLSYLHKKRRLSQFINLQTFYPSRHEFNDYLAWAADHFHEFCSYDEEVIEVQPEMCGNEVALLRVRSTHGVRKMQERLTRHLVVSIGGTARIPPAFRDMQDPRIFHSSKYLGSLSAHSSTHKFAVIGAGQSAAEIFLDLYRRHSTTEVDLITHSRALRPSDNSPFVNEVFNPDFTGFVFSKPQAERSALLAEFMSTNYAAPDKELIEEIYKLLYHQEVTGKPRCNVIRRREIERVRLCQDGIELTLINLDSGHRISRLYGAVVLATGYLRDYHRSLLSPLATYLADFTVERDYCLRGSPNFRPTIFLQGCCEGSHGISDTLLSVMAIRASEISDALQRNLENVAQRSPAI